MTQADMRMAQRIREPVANEDAEPAPRDIGVLGIAVADQFGVTLFQPDIKTIRRLGANAHPVSRDVDVMLIGKCLVSQTRASSPRGSMMAISVPSGA